MGAKNSTPVETVDSSAVHDFVLEMKPYEEESDEELDLPEPVPLSRTSAPYRGALLRTAIAPMNEVLRLTVAERRQLRNNFYIKRHRKQFPGDLGLVDPLTGKPIDPTWAARASGLHRELSQGPLAQMNQPKGIAGLVDPFGKPIPRPPLQNRVEGAIHQQGHDFTNSAMAVDQQVGFGIGVPPPDALQRPGGLEVMWERPHKRQGWAAAPLNPHGW